MWISYMQCYAVLSDASLPPPHISTPSVHHHHCLAASPLHDQTLHKYVMRLFSYFSSAASAHHQHRSRRPKTRWCEYFLAMAESYLKNLGTRKNKFLSPTPSSLFSMSYVQSHYQMPCVCNHDTISASIVHHLPIYPLLSVAVELWCVGRIWCMC